MKTHNEVELIGVIDPVKAARHKVAEEFDITPLADYRSVLDQFEAAVIAAPTTLHHRIATELMSAGKHVLVEKPIACTTDEARDMVSTANSNQVVLQVGHVERFNPALAAARMHIDQPKYIEGARTSGYTFRSTDIGVVLDLMIHDLDIVLSLVDSPLRYVEAIGFAVMGDHEDMAQARLTFANGCVANLTASRTSFEQQRKMSVFSESGFVGLDFASGNAVSVEPCEQITSRQFDLDALSPEQREHYKQHFFEELLPMQALAGVPCNAIEEEQKDFVTAIRTGRAVQVPGEHGLAALAAAEAILARIQTHRWDGNDSGRFGPLANPYPTVVSPDWGREEERRKAG
jgi:predicted dehydrogenase